MPHFGAKRFPEANGKGKPRDLSLLSIGLQIRIRLTTRQSSSSLAIQFYHRREETLNIQARNTH